MVSVNVGTSGWNGAAKQRQWTPEPAAVAAAVVYVLAAHAGLTVNEESAGTVVIARDQSRCAAVYPNPGQGR